MTKSLFESESVIRKTLTEIINVFSGADGGIGFVKLKCLLESLEKNAERGDDSAKQLLDVVFRFNRLVQYAIKE